MLYPNNLRAEKLRCKNKVGQKSLQVVTKHGTKNPGPHLQGRSGLDIFSNKKVRKDIVHTCFEVEGL